MGGWDALGVRAKAQSCRDTLRIAIEVKAQVTNGLPQTCRLRQEMTRVVTGSVKPLLALLVTCGL